MARSRDRRTALKLVKARVENARAFALNANTGVFKLAPSGIAHRAAQIKALGPVAWYRFGQGFTFTATGTLSRWADRSGFGRDLVQATPSARPTVGADSAVVFDGALTFLQGSGPSMASAMPQPSSIFFLLKPVTSGNNRSIFDMGIGATFKGSQASANLVKMQSAASILTSSIALPLGSYGVIGMTFNSVNSIISVNTTEATGDAGTDNPDGVFYVATDNSQSLFSRISIKEIILFPAALTASQRAFVISYLRLVGGV